MNMNLKIGGLNAQYKVKYLIHLIMVYTKEEFKRLWEANSCGSGITYDDIAECAKAWGISSLPRTRPVDEITYKVLKAAQTNDAEEYNPNPASQCEGRIMIDLDKAVEWLEKNYPSAAAYYETVESFIEQFRKAMNNGCSNDGKLIVKVYAHVRYWQDSKINGVYDDPEDPQMPCVAGADDDKYWVPKIEADTGLILNWTPGVEASIHYKVCDECELTFTKGDAVVSKYDGYVPDFLCPKEEGYGDYIIMDIDSNGYIKNWDKVKDKIEI